MSITVLTEADIRTCAGLDREAFSAVADGFTALAEGRAKS